MSNYTKNTNFSAKDSLPTGDPDKIILGSLFDSEFDEIAVAIASKEDAANKNQNNGYAGLDSSGKLPTSLFGNTTVPDAALSSNVPLKNAQNTFTNDQILSTATTTRLYLSTTGGAADQGRTYLSTAAPDGTFAITSINDAGNAFRTLLQGTKSGVGWATITFGNTTDNPTYTFAGNGAITGVGSGLTSLNASNLASGTVADARLSNNVPLKNASNTFTVATQVISASGANLLVTDGTVQGRFIADPSGVYVQARSNHPLNFTTNDTTRGSISAAGNWTINAPSSGAALTVNGLSASDAISLSGASNVRMGLAAGGHQAYIGIDSFGADTLGIGTNGATPVVLSTNATNRLSVGAAGNVTINAPSSGTALTVNGSVQIGSPTGGDKGAGTLNAAGDIYINNVSVRNASGINAGTLDNARLPSTISVTTLQQGGVNVASLPAVTSTSTTLAAGRAHYITGNATLPALAAGEWVSIINNSGSPITISESSGYTTYWTTSGASVSTVTLAARGRLFAEGVGSSVAYVSGDITGFT